jgi:hypothetical protein
VKASNKSSKEKEDIVFGLEIAKQVVANYYWQKLILYREWLNGY